MLLYSVFVLFFTWRPCSKAAECSLALRLSSKTEEDLVSSEMYKSMCKFSKSLEKFLDLGDNTAS